MFNQTAIFSLSPRYGGDHKDAITLTEHLLPILRLSQVTLTLPLSIPTAFGDYLSKSVRVLYISVTLLFIVVRIVSVWVKVCLLICPFVLSLL